MVHIVSSVYVIRMIALQKSSFCTFLGGINSDCEQNFTKFRNNCIWIHNNRNYQLSNSRTTNRQGLNVNCIFVYIKSDLYMCGWQQQKTRTHTHTSQNVKSKQNSPGKLNKFVVWYEQNMEWPCVNHVQRSLLYCMWETERDNNNKTGDNPIIFPHANWKKKVCMRKFHSYPFGNDLKMCWNSLWFYLWWHFIWFT